MSTTTTVNLVGLEEVQEYFSDKRIKKAVAVGMATFVTNLHSGLRTSIHNRYTGNQDISKQLHRGSSTVKFGKSILTAGLVYDVNHSDLSKFKYSASYGALNKGDGALNKGDGALNKGDGWVHTVEVVRGQRKVLKGKRGKGGFTPRTGSSKQIHGRAKRVFNSGAQMLERKGRRRKPLRVLYGPNTANMINRALEKDTAVKKVIDNFPNIVGDLIDA